MRATGTVRGRRAPRAGAAILALCVAAASPAWPAIARAQLEARCEEVLDDAEVMGRLHWLERLLERTERKGRRWFWTWLSLHAVIAGTGTGLAFAETDPLRRDAFAIVAATSTGMIGLMTTPPFPSASVLRRFRRLPDATLTQRRAKLERSIEMLRRAAAFEARGRAWYRHALALTFATTESFFLGVRHRNRPAASILAGAGTLALLEAQIVTTPRAAFRASIDFEYGSRPCMAPQLRDAVGPAGPAIDLVPVPGGIGVGLSW